MGTSQVALEPGDILVKLKVFIGVLDGVVLVVAGREIAVRLDQAGSDRGGITGKRRARATGRCCVHARRVENARSAELARGTGRLEQIDGAGRRESEVVIILEVVPEAGG